MTVAAASGARPPVLNGPRAESRSSAAFRGFGALTGRSGLPRLAAGAGVALGVAAAAEFGGTDSGASLCAVRHLTGGYCPGCGASRAARHLLHGDVSSAWADHPWVVLGAAQLVTILAALLIVVGAAWARRSAGARLRSWHGAVRPVVVSGALLNVVLLVGLWGARLAAGEIPSPF